MLQCNIYKKILYYFAHKNIKNCPKKVAYITAQSEFFSTANRTKTSSNLISCGIMAVNISNSNVKQNTPLKSISITCS